VVSHVFTGHIPDCQQNAMTFMVARAILVGLSEIAQCDWPIRCRNNFGEQDLLGRAGKHIAAANSSLRFH
jgi:hypothetical protein